MMSPGFQPAKHLPIVKTSMMREAIDRTLHFHNRGGGVILWQGAPGIGMTTSAVCLVRLLEQTCLPNDPSTFRALHYPIGHCGTASRNKVKQALRTLYQAATQTLLDYESSRKTSTEGLALKLVTELMKDKKKILMLDEVSGLIESFLHAVRLVLFVAQEKRWRLTFVLINSSNDKPSVRKPTSALPYSADDFIRFRGLGLEETWTMLSMFHPHFKKYHRCSSSEIREQVEFIHHECRGMPAQVVRLIRRMDFLLKKAPAEIDLNLLRAVIRTIELDSPLAAMKSVSKLRVKRFVDTQQKIVG